ncbi:hypothetical protein B0H17DRAFT_1190614 [Mycena rosella]|uniref:Uncharacterized protein n=1 Tax=Mycena rosella TaxID=1033263 RepID=A0AAD7H322_MYCRO|nr:hypothetical protein B0H17DRAFT_1190614 [Mycena rosella]
MKIFNGELAFFSPRVPDIFLLDYSRIGGKLAKTRDEILRAVFYFCDSRDDTDFIAVYVAYNYPSGIAERVTVDFRTKSKAPTVASWYFPAGAALSDAAPAHNATLSPTPASARDSPRHPARRCCITPQLRSVSSTGRSTRRGASPPKSEMNGRMRQIETESVPPPRTALPPKATTRPSVVRDSRRATGTCESPTRGWKDGRP